MKPTNLFPVELPNPFEEFPDDQYYAPLHRSAQKLQNGARATHASTGRPMSEISGGARIDATLAAMGGGAINKGGQGMRGGLSALLQYAFNAGRVYEHLQNLDQQDWE